ncbi:L-fucose isomerase [Meinhardsimonia xiamenensis]|jgi:L-fucose isomerase-like protein|uniref:L-fucose isomerase n=1 Tax=Meinhardsimonia xiamenensis TaxID=990712 RepID=A0A1G9D206_9RHOB|nr:hypothetical protein [Meinhardsimonia xiamenensis]PRX38158.1 L-fucose isomerase-like protein [Meinhardsimonia xiamenensis]SDK57978.1 L-fucose isomerase [Meinhardsimonia xiamenensis]
MRVGILPLGRATFDVAYAEERLAAMLAALEATGAELVGPRHLLTGAEETAVAIDALTGQSIDRLLILQVTFTDAAATVAAAARIGAPLAIWAVPEPRAGGRLRLNAFCGLNLAAHALGRRGIGHGWLYASPETAGEELAALLAGARDVEPLEGAPMTVADDALATGREIAARIAGRRIARIGAPPEGFDTCLAAPGATEALAGVALEEWPLERLFETARAAAPEAVDAVRAEAGAVLEGLEAVDEAALERSLRLAAALKAMRGAGQADAFAIRCWPEMFTEWGGAVCGPAAMLGEARAPCACEADVFGALTQIVLQEVAQAPVFLADVVDVDAADDSAVLWHCGQAPASMRDPAVPAVATIHSNRRLPLLYEFPLKPGRVTLARISQARGRQKMVIATGEMLSRPLAFSGTAGVMRFDRPAGEVLGRIIGAGLEHHVALAYGDHAETLRAVAAALELPVLEL